MRLVFIPVILLAILLSRTADAALVFIAPDIVVGPGIHTFDIHLDSTSALNELGSVGLRFQIGDGEGLMPEPSITSVTYSGGGYLFDAYPTGLAGGPFLSPSGSELILDLSNIGAPYGYSGEALLATIQVDTTAFTAGTFSLTFANSVGDSFVNNPSGEPYTVSFSSGSITAVPEPTSFAFVGLAGAGIGVWRRRAKSKSEKPALAV